VAECIELQLRQLDPARRLRHRAADRAPALELVAQRELTLLRRELRATRGARRGARLSVFDCDGTIWGGDAGIALWCGRSNRAGFTRGQRLDRHTHRAYMAAL